MVVELTGCLDFVEGAGTAFSWSFESLVRVFRRCQALLQASAL